MRADDGCEKEKVGWKVWKKIQKKKYMDEIKALTEYKRVNEVMRLAEDQSTLRSTVANINIDTALR